MSPCIFSCVICGYSIYDFRTPNSTSWINQFRILYSSQGRIAVTGVGFYNDVNAGDWRAPLDFSGRWDEPDSACYQIGVLRQRPIEGRYGFPFHESCWSLLEQAYSQESIPYKALYELCRSLPFPSLGTGLNWGHDFGGLLSVDNEDCYPWEDRFIDRDGGSAQYLTARYDPYFVPEIQQLPYEPSESPPAINYSGPVKTTADCFDLLPLEIRIAVASQLPTVDALNARQASRSFGTIFYSQQFWASRFKANADRSWLFEAREWVAQCDWRWLYRRTNKAYLIDGMRNRERVWNLVRQVQENASLQWTEPPVLGSPGLDQPNLRWREATGDLRPKTRTDLYHDYGEGCRQFYEQQTSVPSRLCQMRFSIIQLGDAKYIAGIRLIPSQGQGIQLGYKVEGKELVLDVSFLAGFNLAVGARGIQGIQCILDNSQTSPWVGCPLEAPKTRRLADSGPITGIRAGFDGCKMVTLAISKCASIQNMTEETRSLRDLAFWYPRIPETSLFLNEDYFTARDTSTTRYQPLCCAQFGGPKGIYLCHLTGISVTFQGTLRGIEFHYNTKDVPPECRRVGRYRASSYEEVMHFPIDGPGGEFIDGMKLYLRYFFFKNVLWYDKQGALESLEISTNRGRSHHFERNMPHTPPAEVKRPILTTPGSTITGIYWSQHAVGLTALGAVSEMIGGERSTASQDIY